MEAKKTKKNFFQRNIYYFVLAFALLAVIALTLYLALYAGNNNSNVLNSSGGQVEEVPKNSSITLPPNDNSNSGNTDSEPDGPDGPTDGEPDDGEQNQPVQTVVSFVMPVENATVICDYTATSVVYNQTLNIYTGHLAIDFAADMGSEVKAVYGGKIESVVTSYLTGTTITVLHDNDIKTVYNSVDAREDLVAGMSVNQGEVIGYVSDNNKQEYKDGPHLHFEVHENGSKVSPYKYLTVDEK